MQRLWAPWRATYITGLDVKKTKCVFCAIAKDKKDADHLIFLRGKHCYAVLNIYPYSNGHCMVLPYRHVGDISTMSKDEQKEFFDLILETKALLQKALKPNGFNLGMNLGRLAGAGIPGHVHMHIVPRWKGDHNFMPVTAGTKVISQSLKTIYKSLRDAYKKRH